MPKEKNREKKPRSIFLLSLPDLPLESSELKDLHKVHKIILPGHDFPQNCLNRVTDPLNFAGCIQQFFTWNLYKISQDVEETKWKRVSTSNVCVLHEKWNVRNTRRITGNLFLH